PVPDGRRSAPMDVRPVLPRRSDGASRVRMSRGVRADDERHSGVAGVSPGYVGGRTRQQARLPLYGSATPRPGAGARRRVTASLRGVARGIVRRLLSLRRDTNSVSADYRVLSAPPPDR